MLKLSSLVITFITLFVTTAYCFGVAPAYSIKFILYNIIYLLLPGYFVYLLICNNNNISCPHFVIIWVLGCFVNIAFTLTSVLIGVEGVMEAYPLLFLLCIYFFKKTNTTLLPKLDFLNEYKQLIALIIFAFVLTFSCELYNFREVYEHHVLWLASYSNSLSFGYPFKDPFIHDVPLNYHYFFNLYIVGAHEVTGIPLDILAGRLSIHLHLVLFFIFLGFFLKEFSGSLLISILLTIQLYLTYGYSSIMWDWFHLATSSIMMRIPSTLLSFEIYIAFSWLLFDCIKNKKIGKRNYLLFFILIALSVGSRANLLPVLICSLTLLVCYELLKKNQINYLLTLIFTCIFFLISGAFYIYGFGGESSGGDVLKLNILNESSASVGYNINSSLYGFVKFLFVNERLSVFLFIIIASVGRMGISLIGLILLFTNVRKVYFKQILVFFVGTYLAGLGAIVIIENYTQEQWAFFWYGDIAIAVMAGVGFSLFFKNKVLFSYYRKPVIFSCLILIGIQSFDYINSFMMSYDDLDIPQSEPKFHNNKTLDDIIDIVSKGSENQSMIYTATPNLLGPSNSYERIIPGLLSNTFLLANDHMVDIFLRNNRNFTLRDWVEEIREENDMTVKATSAAQYSNKNIDLYILTSKTNLVSHVCIPGIFENSEIFIYKVDNKNCTYNKATKKLSQ